MARKTLSDLGIRKQAYSNSTAGHQRQLEFPSVRIRRKPPPQKCLCRSDLYASYLTSVRDLTARFCASYLTTSCARVETLQAPPAPTRGGALSPDFGRMADRVSLWLAHRLAGQIKRLTSFWYLGQRT